MPTESTMDNERAMTNEVAPNHLSENETMLGKVIELAGLTGRATVEYPGYICVKVKSGDPRFELNFGSANETWGADLTEYQDNNIELDLSTPIPTTDLNPKVLAPALLMLLAIAEAFLETHSEPRS